MTIPAMTTDDMVKVLHDGGEHRVLTKFHPVEVYNSDPEGLIKKKIGACLDFETTGLSHINDKPIELGVVIFEFDPLTGLIYDILDVFGMMEDPKVKLNQIITDITGITDDMLTGESFDEEQVNIWLDEVDLIICHNAAFDQSFGVRRFCKMQNIPFACSMGDIDWKAEGVGHNSLQFIAMSLGFFYDAHRAEEDAQVTLHVLSHKLPKSGKPALLALLENARKVEHKVWAVDSHFDTKDVLKERGYKWNDVCPFGEKGKSWAKIVSSDDLDAELEWMRDNVYRSPRNAPTTEITALNRYLKE